MNSSPCALDHIPHGRLTHLQVQRAAGGQILDRFLQSSRKGGDVRDEVLVFDCIFSSEYNIMKRTGEHVTFINANGRISSIKFVRKHEVLTGRHRPKDYWTNVERVAQRAR